MYAAAVFGNRAVAFLNLLLLAYLLDQESFGRYTLLSSNALLLQLVLGSWASASVSKYMPIAEESQRFAPLSTALLGMVLLATMAGTATLGYFAFPAAAVPPADLAVVVGWSLALIAYEVTLAAQNALGRSRAFAVVALSRNLLALVLSLAAAASGAGVVGAAIGQIVGTLLPILTLPSSITVWRRATLRNGSLTQMRRQIAFGVGGLIASGLYILFSATMRNIVAATQGKAATGQLALACDLFFVPLALIVNVLFLTKMPRLYVLSADPERSGERLADLRTIARGLAALVLPFMAAGALVADRLIAAILPGPVGAGLAHLAPAAAVFGGAFALLYATAMMLLIFDYRRWLVVAAIGTVAANAVLQTMLPPQTDVAALLWGASAIVLVSGLVTALRFLAAEQGLPPASLLGKVATATGLMSAVLLAMRWLPLPAAPLAVPIGFAVYVAVLWRMRAFERSELAYLREDRSSLTASAAQQTAA